MSKNRRNLLIALAVLFLLGGGYYLSRFLINRKAQSDESKDAASNDISSYTLGNLDWEDIVKIEAPGITLEKTGETWELSRFEYGTAGKTPPAIELDQKQVSFLAYALASVQTERVIDENPLDISVFGLDNPSSWIMATDSIGKKAVYHLGSATPSKNSYYAMEDGDPKVYTVSAYASEFLSFSIHNFDIIRQRQLFPQFEPGELTLLSIEGKEINIGIEAMPEQIEAYLATSTSPVILTSPYLLPRSMNNEALQNFIPSFSNLQIEKFIDDDPASLSPYGLDDPVRVSLKAGNNSLDLLVGNRLDNGYFAKVPDAPLVFTIRGRENFTSVKPITLIERFILLVNIEYVKHLSITGGEINLNADILDQNDEPEFFLNGKKIEDSLFRNFFTAAIALRIEAEYPGPASSQRPDDDRSITIEYQFKDPSAMPADAPAGGRASITLLPYNRDFYAIEQGGAVEFLVSRNQVRSIFEAANAALN